MAISSSAAIDQLVGSGKRNTDTGCGDVRTLIVQLFIGSYPNRHQKTMEMSKASCHAALFIAHYLGERILSHTQNVDLIT